MLAEDWHKTPPHLSNFVEPEEAHNLYADPSNLYMTCITFDMMGCS